MRISPVFGLLLLCLPASGRATKIAVLPTQIDESAAGKLPGLLDDVVLSAVQEAGAFEVIGQEDIKELIGFERQKELLGCDDVSCFSEIGGALGVDQLVGLKVAFVDGAWVVTSKRVNLSNIKVAARGSDFVNGNAKALLEAVPGIVRALFDDRKVVAKVGVLGALGGGGIGLRGDSMAAPGEAEPTSRATTPPTVEEKPAQPKNDTFAWVLLGSGAALLLGTFGFDLFAPSSNDHDLGFVDFVPIAGYGSGLTLLVWGFREL